MRDHLGVFNVSSDLQFAKGIMLLDDCEGTFNWTADGTGADYSAAYDSSAAFFGTNGMLIKTRATTPAEDDYIVVYKALQLPPSGLLVARCRVCFPDDAEIKYFNVELSYFNGTGRINHHLIWDHQAAQAYYLDSAGANQAISGMDHDWYQGTWCLFELVMDTRAPQYRSALINDVSADLSGLAGETVFSPALHQIYIAFRLVAETTQQAEAYLDSIYAGEFLTI